MNEAENSNPCEDYGPLLSALVDDELHGTELVETMAHLDTCEVCQAELESLTTTARTIEAHQPWGATPALKAIQPKPRRSFWKTTKRLVPWAALAGAVVITASNLDYSGFFVTTREVESDLVTPIASLHEINRRTRNSQNAIRDSLALELRTLRMQIENLPMDVQQRDEFSSRIDELMVRLQQAEPGSKQDDQPHEPVMENTHAQPARNVIAAR